MAKKTNLLGNLNLKALDTINKQEESVNTDLIFSHFNFEFEMEENELDFLKNQTIKLQSTTSKAYTEIGKILSETRERLSNNKTGIFEKWFTELGFSKRTVYNLINRSNYIVQNLHNINFIESLPISLSYELTNPMCLEELREKILSGEIKKIQDFFEKKKILDEKNVEVEVLNFDDIFENDLKIFKKNFNKFNKVVNENFEKISKDKKENLTKEIEFLNKKIEKILKEFN
mgnify:FL=1